MNAMIPSPNYSEPLQEEKNAFCAASASEYATRQGHAPRLRRPPADVAFLEPPATPRKPVRFPLERACDFEPPSGNDWLIKGLLPQDGVGTLFGESGSYKSFIALHIALHVAISKPWGGRKVKHPGPAVYIAVEGARGAKKRIQGLIRAHDAVDPPLYQISKPVNFGTSNEHAEALIVDIEAQGVNPSFIAVDTLSASLNGGEENGTGMSMFLSNCQRLATITLAASCWRCTMSATTPRGASAGIRACGGTPIPEEAIRERYYARMAEKAEPGEAPETVAERQRKASRRSLNSALKAKRLIAAIHDWQTVIWFP